MNAHHETKQFKAERKLLDLYLLGIPRGYTTASLKRCQRVMC